MSAFQNAARILLGSALIFAGTGHLTFARAEFQAQVPDWLPLNVDFVVLASGVVEIALGLLLIFVRGKRHLVGWATAAFFLAVFPGNLHQYFSHIDAFGLDSDSARAIRLLFQPLLMLWAIWSTMPARPSNK